MHADQLAQRKREADQAHAARMYGLQTDRRVAESTCKVAESACKREHETQLQLKIQTIDSMLAREGITPEDRKLLVEKRMILLKEFLEIDMETTQSTVSESPDSREVFHLSPLGLSESPQSRIAAAAVVPAADAEQSSAPAPEELNAAVICKFVCRLN